MKNIKLLMSIPMLLAALLHLPNTSWPQLTTGQYEDEAPSRTWNSTGINTAPAVSMGETQFTLARDCSVSLTNPALLSRLPKFTVTVNGTITRADFFRYSLVNTGAITTQENLSLGIYALDYLGVSYSLKGWTIALSLAILEYGYRPGVHLHSEHGDQIYQTLDFEQEGALSTINFSLARTINDKFSAGLGINFIGGWLEKTIDEQSVYDQITIKDTIKHDFSGFYINGGIVANLTDNLTLGAMLRTSYTKKSDSESHRMFRSSSVTITSDVTASNSYKQPLVIGIGANFKVSENFRVASDLSYFDWSSYKVISFDEELRRDFKDIIKIGAGAEYWASLRFFGKQVRAPLRIGFTYDPQPIKEPDVHYFNIAFGTGLHVGRLSVDLGIMAGKEYGSGNNLNVQKFVMTINYQN